MVEATTSCSIMHAYKLEDYDVEEWLSELWSTKLNSQFKQRINEVPVI